jgi:hypothetical protein
MWSDVVIGEFISDLNDVLISDPAIEVTSGGCLRIAGVGLLVSPQLRE